MKTIYRCALGVTLIVSGLVAAAGSAHAQQGGLPSEMIGVTWNLVSIQRAGGDVEGTSGRGITIIFEADGNAGGSGGCNSYGGKYQAGPGESLTIDEIVSTLIGCAPEIARVEGEYFGALDAVTSYELDGSSLQLFYNGGQGILTFSTATAPGMPRTGAGGASPLLALGGLCIVALASGLLIRRYARRPSLT